MAKVRINTVDGKHFDFTASNGYSKVIHKLVLKAKKNDEFFLLQMQKGEFSYINPDAIASIIENPDGRVHDWTL